MTRPTIKDIARSAGVSPMTVTNVIHGRRAKASADTIKRIEQVIAELGYTPNQSARSLVSNSSRLVGVLTPFTENQNKLLLDNPFYAEMISGIESALRADGYYMMLSGIDESHVDLTSLSRWNVDALIVLGIYREALYESIKALRVPTLLIDSYITDEHFFHLRLDDVAAARQATSYLIGKGHSRIALVTGAVRSDGVIAQRLAGYRAALEEAGIGYADDLVLSESVSFDWGKRAAGRIATDPSITAVFCTADLIAAGVLAGLHAAGKSVPDGISVMGFDNLSISQMVYPALTTIDQAIIKKGETAGRLITEALAGRKIERNVISSALIVERDSVAARTGLTP